MFLARTRARARSASILFALLITVASIGTLATPSPTLAWSSGAFNSDSEQELLALTNETRASAGMAPLRWDGSLASIARWRSQDMITRDYFDHAIPPSGKMAWDVMDERGYCYNLAGENIGWNQNWPDDQATAQIAQSFASSSTHRENIVGRAWDSIGIGAYKGADGKIMWTVLFADRCGSTPAPVPAPAATATRQPSTTLERVSRTRVVTLARGSNNVVWVKFTFPPAMAGEHVQILRAKRSCESGSGGVRCGSGKTYGSWTSFSVLTGRVVDANGVVRVAVSAHRRQWLSLVASFPGDADHEAMKTTSQQVRWR
jgi:uncharacterized protein YkwD